MDTAISRAVAATATGARSSVLPVDRKEQARTAFLSTVDSLKRRRADLVSEALIDDFVALNWLEWNGGSLRLTVTGTNVYQQMQIQLN